MCKINIDLDLGSAADWLSGIGTTGALVWAIYLVARDSKTKLDIFVINDRFRWDSKGENPDTYEICITNVKARPVHLRAFYGNRFKKKRLTRMTDANDVTLGMLSFGEMKIQRVTINFKQLAENLGAKVRKKDRYYIGVEDLSGNIHYKKFTP